MNAQETYHRYCNLIIFGNPTVTRTILAVAGEVRSHDALLAVAMPLNAISRFFLVGITRKPSPRRYCGQVGYVLRI